MVRRTSRPAILTRRTYSAPFAGALDSYTANLWGAYGVKRYLTSYSGALVRVRESGGNTEADIGASGANLDTSALLAHVGANSGFVRTYYDQSGGGRHFLNATASNQPRVANAGVYEGKLVFDGSNDGLACNTVSGSNAAITVYMRGKLRSIAATQILLEQSTDFGANNDTIAIYWSIGVSPNSMETWINRSGGSDNENRYANQPNDNVHCYVFDPSQASSSSIKQYIAGSLSTPSGTPIVTTNTSPIGSYVYYLGGRNSGASLAAALDLDALLIYTAAHDATTVAAISAALA